MNIALIASDKKKELMVQFCIAYGGILEKHRICATATTGKIVSDATGLEVYRFLRGSVGGGEQIASRIAYNEIDALFFFRDPMATITADSEEWTLLRLCDIHNIPLATNIAPAEILVQAIARGDLDWRETYDKSKQLF